MKGLMLHAGAEPAEWRDLTYIKTPLVTRSHVPIPHHRLVDAVTRQLSAAGMQVASEEFGLSKDGQKFFGLLNLATGRGNPDGADCIGIRNSHDKSFSASLAAGRQVFVCDNLSFSGEVTLSRRHTANIKRDLTMLLTRCIDKLMSFRRTQDERFDAYRDHGVDDFRFHDLAVNAIDARVIGTNRLKPLLEEWRNPRHEAFEPRTLYSAFNAFTEVLKPCNIHTLPARTTRLHGLCDLRAGLHYDDKETAANASDVLDPVNNANNWN